MIYSLTGTVAEKSPDTVVLDVNGIAFAVSVPMNVCGALPEIGKTAKLYTYLSVKEDAMDLYGFATYEEQKCFKTLISVSGVGPKAGLSILSVLSPAQIAVAVASGDYKSLTAAQGVGPKVAQRIVLELKGKLDSASFARSDTRRLASAVSSGGNVGTAIRGLVALGYTQSRAALAVSKLDKDLSVQDMIKQALRLIAGGKV